MLTWLHMLGSRMCDVTRRHRVDDDFDRELQSHLEMLAAENVRR